MACECPPDDGYCSRCGDLEEVINTQLIPALKAGQRLALQEHKGYQPGCDDLRECEITQWNDQVNALLSEIGIA